MRLVSTMRYSCSRQNQAGIHHSDQADAQKNYWGLIDQSPLKP